MKWGQVDGDAAAPTVVDWLKSTLRAGQRVGADAKLVSADQWLEWTSQLGRAHPSPSVPVAPIDNHLLLQLKSKNLFPHNFHGHKNPNDMISLASVFFSWWFFCWKFRYLHRKWFLQVLVLSGSAHIDIEKWVINYELKQNHSHANKDRAGILLDSVHSDLVDVIWTKARPSVSHRPVFVHDLSYAGKHVLVQSKPLVSLVKHRCHR